VAKISLFCQEPILLPKANFAVVSGFSGRRKSVCCRKQVFGGGQDFPFCQEPILLPKEKFAVVSGFSGRRKGVCCRKKNLPWSLVFLAAGKTFVAESKFFETAKFFWPQQKFLLTKANSCGNTFLLPNEMPKIKLMCPPPVFDAR